jgi:hypothetical protein
LFADERALSAICASNVPYLLAAESLAYVCASFAWWRVWKHQGARELSVAAFSTCLCVGLTAFRIGLQIVLSVRV